MMWDSAWKRRGSLALLCGVAYFPALWGAFVWDDRNILDRSFPTGWKGLADIWSNPSVIPAEEYYWPLTYTSLWFDLQLWGKNAFGFHLTNIILHSANTLLLFALLSRLAVPAAWFAAAIFAVHPVHVDSVAWIIERKDVLSGLFSFSAINCYACHIERERRSSYWGSLILFVCALLSKSIAVTLPATLVLVFWWKRDSFTRSDLIGLCPFVFVSAIFAFLTLHPDSEAAAIPHFLGWVDRIQLASVSLLFYSWKIVWPFSLTPVYPRWEIETWGLFPWTCLAAVVLLTVFLFRGIPRWGKGPLVGWLCYVVTLFPMLGFLYFDYMEVSFVADRFQYLASAALIALLVTSLYQGRAIWSLTMRTNLCRQSLGTIALVALAISCAANSLRYETEEAFWRKTHASNGKSWLVLNNLAVEVMRQGRFEEAVDLFRQVTGMYPEDYKGFYNLGVAHLKRGDIGGAREALRRGLALNPKFRPLHLKLAEVLELTGEPAEAERVRLQSSTLQSESTFRHSEARSDAQN